MRILVAGGGGREHALAWACARSAGVEAIVCTPGNAGTATFATNVAVAATDVEGVVRVAREQRVDLVVIGPDDAIAAGLADACARERIPVFGPTAAAGRIESSKRFAKEVMARAQIPTARWRAGGLRERDQLAELVVELGGRCVIKADGLALGKGVLICDRIDQAMGALDACLVEQRFGAAGQVAIVEERLSGPEVSILALSDGRTVRMLGAARDYKRIRDGDEGPNTGGMGAYTPPHGVDVDSLLDEMLRTVVQPCIDALRAADVPFQGCLYPGIMLTPEGPRVLEYNARFGDPETQVLLPLVEEDLAALLMACATGTLQPGRVRLSTDACVGVVAASAGYPGAPVDGATVHGLDAVAADTLVFHAGTRMGAAGEVVTRGGRVLLVAGRGSTVEEARARAYAGMAHVRFEGMQHRSDIAAPPRS